MAGGFNSEPDSEPIRTFTEGAAEIMSAHKQFFGHEAVFTKHKYKDNTDGAVSQTLDYMWYTNGFNDTEK